MASDIISQVGKGKRQGVLEAIADTDVAKQIAGSPLGQGIATTVRGIASGAAVPTAFAADQTNTALNAVGGALGFNANLPTDSTSKVMSWGAGQQNQSTVPAIASTPQQPSIKPPAIATVPAIAGGVATPYPTGSKDQFVTAAGGASLVLTPKAIAAMTPGNLQTVGKMMDTGLSSSGVRRMDAINQKAIAGIGTPGNGVLDDKGRTYDEQVAHAKQVNAANALPTMSPKQAAELAIANDPRRSRVTRANAAQGVAQFNNQMENAKVLLGNQQYQTIAGIKEKGDKYTSDQHLAGVKYNADAHTKAAEIAGGAAVAKAQQEAKLKAGDQKQKDTTALQSKVYDQTINGYDFTGIAPTTKHEYATPG